MMVCALSFSTLADSASLTEEWHARHNTSLAALSSTAIGNGFYVRVVEYSSDVLLSHDGTRWARHSSGIPNSLYAVAFGQGRFVAVGNEGALVTSADGTHWKRANSRTDDRLRSIVFAKGQFVAVGYSGTVITSPDGLAWTKRNAKTENRLQAVTFVNGQFVATARNGEMISSPDGKRWNEGAPATDLVSVK